VGSVLLGALLMAGGLPTPGALLCVILAAAAAAFANARWGVRLWRSLGVLFGPRVSPLARVIDAIGAPLVFLILFAGALNHPIWRSDDAFTLDAWSPSAMGADWQPVGFYYSVGYWPQSLRGAPVLPLVPYQKGPPQQFVGRVTLRWDWPEARVHIDGPRTPETISRGTATRENLKACFARSRLGILLSPACASLRTDTWKRLELPTGRIRWFEVQQTRLPEDERPQGLWLESTEASSGLRRETAVLVNAAGAMQAMTLEITAAREENRAREDRETFRQVIRSLRLTRDLGITRTIADHELLSAQASPSATPGQLARAQMLFASKLSADPAAAEAYFHLAGTAWLLARVPGLGGWAKAQIFSAQAFLKDVAPNFSRQTELDTLAAQARGL
jgi:hypothetical protein